MCWTIFEGMTRYLFKGVAHLDIQTPFPRMSWYDAMKAADNRPGYTLESGVR